MSGRSARAARHFGLVMAVKAVLRHAPFGHMFAIESATTFTNDGSTNTSQIKLAPRRQMAGLGSAMTRSGCGTAALGQGGV